GASFEPKPRKPAASTLQKESAEVRAEHIARAGGRLAAAAAALHPAAEELTARTGEAPWARRILDELAQPLQRVLETMHEGGMEMDKKALAALRGELAGFVAQAKHEASAIVGEEVNLASPWQLQEVPFESLALPTTRKISSGNSTAAESLTDLRESRDP